VYEDKVVGSGDDSIVPGYALLAWAILPLKENRRDIRERWHLYLKVLSKEMDPPNIRSILRGRRGGFKKNPPVPHPVRAL
jgi:hypothetical protein